MSAAKLYVTARTDTPFQVVYRDPTKREKFGRAKRIIRWFADRKAAETYQADLNETLLIEGVAGVAFDANVRADAQAARQLLDLAGHYEVSLRWLAEVYTQRVTHQPAASEPIGEAIRQFLDEKERAGGRTGDQVRFARREAANPEALKKRYEQLRTEFDRVCPRNTHGLHGTDPARPCAP